MTILFVANRPDGRLPALARALTLSNHRIVVVDDGSGEAFAPIFEEIRALGAEVLTHISQKGRGAAFRTGLSHISKTDKTGCVVTAGWDGEYSEAAILDICRATALAEEKTIVLGARKFIGRMPMQIAFGSWLSRIIFAFAFGRDILDLQTALRGFSSGMLPWLLKLKGESYNYEINMILDAPKTNVKIMQIEIETQWKKSSAPWPPADSIGAFWPLIKFCLSGTLEAGVAYTLLFLIESQINNLFLSTVIARVASSGVNFTINKYFVFNTTEAHRTPKELIGYYFFYGLLMLTNYLCLQLFYETLHMHITLSVILTECVLFLLSYTFQNKIVFCRKLQN